MAAFSLVPLLGKKTAALKFQNRREIIWTSRIDLSSGVFFFAAAGQMLLLIAKM